MLSILIPCYNQNVVTLVNALIHQCESKDIVYAISVYDDASEDYWKAENQALSKYKNVTYLELPCNIGRSKMRNLLAKDASYDLLLFLDGDSGIIRADFIKKYIREARHYKVILGGTAYQDTPPSLNKRLHWKYGRNVESASLAKRKKHPVNHFHSNNFLIHKSVFERIQFDESLTQYGYEDVLLGKMIADHGFTIHHIDNPVEHLGIDSTEKFISKQKKAVQNLARLQDSNTKLTTNLIIFYIKMKRLGLLHILMQYFQKREAYYLDKLHGHNPPLWVLQYAKLYWYHQATQV